MNRYRIMANCMQASIFLPDIQYFKKQKLNTLINKCACKPSFLLSGYIVR